MTTRLGLPPRVCNGTLTAAYGVKIPSPRVRVDRLTYRSEHSQRRTIIRRYVRVALTLKRSNRGGRSVEMSYFVSLRDVPQATGIRVTRHSFKHNLRGCVYHGTVRNIRMSRDPAAVGCAEEHLAAVVVERVLESRRGIHHVTTRGMLNPFRCASRARRVQHKQRRLRIHPFHSAFPACSWNNVVPPHVPTTLHLYLGARPSQALQHQLVFDNMTALLA
mmetsp:Transcript_7585/g.16143  ORF Transcript_7585/g.16143 Transcript_7585/m.16143 type:complete len:219 (+) Transcript_7585:621-1277(+)